MTEYCKYHPLVAATFSCHSCHSGYGGRCDQCIEVTKRYKPARCLSCHEELEDLGGSNEAIPFWRRLEQGFRYPLKTETLILLAAISFLMTILSYVPYALLWILMLTGTLFKYSLACLERTAKGNMEAPDITNAYGGGLTLLGKLVAMIAILFGIVIAVYVYVGPMMSALCGTIILLSLPAVIINFAMTASVLESVNPEANYRLIKAIGLPYGLLVALLMVMFISVSIAGNIIPGSSFVGATLQSLVANYYLIVSFHLMGYMLYQYQHELGYSARLNGETALELRSERDKLSSLIDIHLKEGNFQKVLQLFSTGLKNFPADAVLHKQCFEFILATKNTEYLPSIASKYLLHLQASARVDLIAASYKRVVQVMPEFIPTSPESRLALAKQYHGNNDYKMVVRVVNGMHKEFPESDQLIPAYDLMAQAFEQLPNLHERASQVRSVIKKLEQLKVQRIKQHQQDREAEKIKATQEKLPALDVRSVSLKNKKASSNQSGEPQIISEHQAKSGPVNFMTGPAFDTPIPVKIKSKATANTSLGGAVSAESAASIDGVISIEGSGISVAEQAAGKPRGVKKRPAGASDPNYKSRTDRMAGVLEARFLQQAEEAKATQFEGENIDLLEGADNRGDNQSLGLNQKKPKDNHEQDILPIDFD